MASRVSYKASVEKDLKRLGKTEAAKIIDKIEGELARDPHKGTPLKGSFKGLYRYRVGDYRVVYATTEGGILVLRIGHRKDIYKA